MKKTVTVREYVKALNERNISSFLILLLCADLAFILLYCIDRIIPGPNHPMLNIGVDRSYPEIYQYIKFFWIILLLIHVSSKNKSLHYVAWASVFTYFLLDDSIEIHELIGERIAAHLNFMPPFGLRIQEVGEIAVLAIAGAALALVVIWTYGRGSQTFRRVSQDIALLVLVFVFCGVVMDTAHSAISAGKVVELILGIMEDGGEMIAGSFLLGYIFLLEARGDDMAGSLAGLARLALTRKAGDQANSTGDRNSKSR